VIFIVIVAVIVPILNLDAGSWILDARFPTRPGVQGVAGACGTWG
jgi:hypothetical protein